MNLCPKCGETKLLNAFGKNAANADGLQAHCRSCLAARRAELRAADPEKFRKRNRDYYENNRERHLATAEAWRLRNIERVRELEEINRALRPEVRLAAGARHRVHRLGAAGRGVTAIEWKEIRESTCGLCSYCGQPAHSLALDHIDPIEHGGAHEPENLAAVCRACNSSKATAPLLIWLARRAA